MCAAPAAHYPYMWPTGMVDLLALDRATRRVASEQRHGSPWLNEFHVADDTPREQIELYRYHDAVWLHPAFQLFMESMPPGTRDLLMAWTRANRAHVDSLPAHVRQRAASLIFNFKVSSLSANSQHDRGVDSLQRLLLTAAPDQDDEEVYVDKMSPPNFAAALFTGYATKLSRGMVLFEGRGWDTLDTRKSRQHDFGVGTVVTRARFTSTSWHPESALAHAMIRLTGAESIANSTNDKLVSHLIREPTATLRLGSLLVHKIASPNVLAVDFANEPSEEYWQEREILLQPYIRFHVCSDAIAVLPCDMYQDGHVLKQGVVVRVFYTHVYTEARCPMCTPAAHAH